MTLPLVALLVILIAAGVTFGLRSFGRVLEDMSEGKEE